eukprot:CAMPEP_0201710668 /NCGR_PEP_ID=MMETSP0578-20130828/58741_1 /ASSEMBLY_ACC=CAM_ASM_000663 /TAXON_ID=267565 /ORGANISM="Skeletonema grethea, Strain CCMP 1804" /LENGTH=285 /DNA_ID=CAMNT_0048199699 /DNA_START=648 /DNA_END=1505 /DNA_ORIENTATION=-
MVNTRASKRKSPPANNASVASAKRTRRDVSDDEEVCSDHPTILIQPRENDFSAKTWWMVDLSPVEEASLQGASALTKRCMRAYSWDETKARKVLSAYRQFIILKKELKDWDAKILSPCHLVDQMWHCHILDVVNYCHDMMLLCGHIVGHNPDGALDSAAKQKRDKTTRVSLKERFGSYDEKVWGNGNTIEMRYDDTPNERGAAIHDMSMTIIIIDQEGEEVMFNNVRSTVKMGELFNLYAANKGIDILSMRFLLDGFRVCDGATPASLDLDDGDRITCFLQQAGC